MYDVNTCMIVCARLLKVVDEFERRLSASACSESLVRAVDSKFRKSAQEVHIRYSKVGRETRGLSDRETRGQSVRYRDSQVQGDRGLPVRYRETRGQSVTGRPGDSQVQGDRGQLVTRYMETGDSQLGTGRPERRIVSQLIMNYMVQFHNEISLSINLLLVFF